MIWTFKTVRVSPKEKWFLSQKCHGNLVSRNERLRTNEESVSVFRGRREVEAKLAVEAAPASGKRSTPATVDITTFAGRPAA
jgi:hypothetical protein